MRALSSTFIAALVSAVTSTGTLVVAWLNYRSGRRKVRFKFEWGDDGISLKIRNVGRNTVWLGDVGIRVATRPFSILGRFRKPRIELTCWSKLAMRVPFGQQWRHISVAIFYAEQSDLPLELLPGQSRWVSITFDQIAAVMLEILPSRPLGRRHLIRDTAISVDIGDKYLVTRLSRWPKAVYFDQVTEALERRPSLDSLRPPDTDDEAESSRLRRWVPGLKRRP